MFTPRDRDLLRSTLLELAAADPAISAAAITGSAAEGREDRWSDIDLAFSVADGASLSATIDAWTDRMYADHLAVHHLDVLAGPWTYRVFLRSDTLQVDLAFVAESEFRALSPTFRLVFGSANEPRHVAPPSAESLIGFGWLYALHARGCIVRGRPWQAAHMIAGIRDNAMTLACLRHGLPTAHGRGFDLLPADETARFEDSLVRGLDAAALSRAFHAAAAGLLEEVRLADADLAARVESTIRVLMNAPA